MEFQTILQRVLQIIGRIKPQQVLPLILIFINIAAAVVCAIHKDYKKSVYWIAAAVLNVTVTF